MIDTAALREKVLDLAIRGKLVPQDPNDEPASVLLERIRQQKQQMVKDGKLKPKDIKGDTVIFVGDDNLHYEKFADGIVKCIEDEIPFDLPDNWAWVRLQSISSMANGTAKRKGSEGTETIVLRLADLGETEISFTNTRQVVLTDGEIQKYALSVGDVLFVRVNGSKENVGKSYCYDNESFPIAYCDHLIRCTPTGALCGKLLSIFMRCGYVRQLIGERTVSAAGQHTISQPSLASILLPVPPLKEQDRIIYRLNRTDSYISQISNSKQELAEIVLHAKAKILDLAIRGKLTPQDPSDEPASVLLERIRAEKEELIRQGKIKRDKKESVIFRGDDNSYYGDLPKGWSVATLSSLTHASLLNDGDWILSENMVPIGDVKLVQLGSVGSMRYVDKGFKYLTTETFDALGCTQIYPGFMLINRIVSDRLCACILPSIEGKLITTVDTCWIAPCENWYSLEYLMYAVSSPAFQSLVLLNSAGTTRKRISKNNLISLPIPFPPLQEQKRIVEAVDVAFAQLDTIANSL